MKHFLLSFLFVASVLPSLAQTKVYQQLFKHYPGLKKESITFIEERGSLKKASFMYKEKKRVAYFNDDSTISFVKRIISEKELPLSIRQDLKCIYVNYHVLEVSLWQYMEDDAFKPEKNYTIVTGRAGATDGKALVYLNSVRPQSEDVATLETSDYEVMSIAHLGVRPCSGEAWYGGSADAFAADMQQKIQFKNDSCIQRFAGTTYTLKIEVEENGGIASWNIYDLTPYSLDKKLKEYFLGLKFPPQTNIEENRGWCRWEYKVELIIEAHGNIIVRKK